MKKYLFIFALLLGAVSSWGQDLSKDLVVIDNSCPNAEQLKTQFSGQPNVVVVLPTAISAPEQIASALGGKTVTDLHLYVSTKPGTLGFGNIALNPETIQDQTTSLAKWASHVTGKVIVHSAEVFTSAQGLALKAKLEQITEINFIGQ